MEPPNLVKNGAITYQKLRSLEAQFDGGGSEPPDENMMGYGAYCIRAESGTENKKTGKKVLDITGHSTELSIIEQVEKACEIRRANNEVCREVTVYINKYSDVCNPPRIELKKNPPSRA